MKYIVALMVVVSGCGAGQSKVGEYVCSHQRLVKCEGGAFYAADCNSMSHLDKLAIVDAGADAGESLVECVGGSIRDVFETERASVGILCQ